MKKEFKKGDKILFKYGFNNQEFFVFDKRTLINFENTAS
jgi:hypothetical protein